MNFWEFNLNTLDVWLYIGLITCALLIGNVIRRKVGFIRKSLLPTSIIGGLLILILKIIGVAYIVEFGAQISRDAGEEAIASKIELGGKIIIMVLSMPILLALIDLIIKILP